MNGRKLLDPRTFPVERLAELVHALPPPGVPLDVADAPGGERAVTWLAAHGRPARLVPAPETPQPTLLWGPSPSLAEWIDKLQARGHALDLGCGTGRDAVWLAMHGWRVTAVDHLPDALDRARSLAELHGVALDLRQLDIERDELPLSSPRQASRDDDPGASGDERGLGGETGEGFDLVLAVRYLPDLAKAATALAKGGTLLIETFTDRERARTGKPRDPALVLPAAGPPPLPKGLTLADYRVAEYDGRELATLTAKRL